jgi:hypothetical protein
VALASVAALAYYSRPAPAEHAPVQLEVSIPSGVVLPTREVRTNIALSPDGRHLAFIALGQGRTQI